MKPHTIVLASIMLLLTSCTAAPPDPWAGTTQPNIPSALPYSDGTITLVASVEPAAYDLDMAVAGLPGADLVLPPPGGSGGISALTPGPGAVFRLLDPGAAQPDPTTCQLAIQEATNRSIPELVAGRRICLRTDQDRLAALEIVSARLQAGRFTLTLNYRLWQPSANP